MISSLRQQRIEVWPIKRLVVRSDGEIVDGHLRLKAARELGLTEIPVIPLQPVDLDAGQLTGFRPGKDR